jgi:4-hydroxybenzoate polyprenyltransferase
MTALNALIAGMRPRQWTKNLIVLLGVLFARHLGDAELLLRSVQAFFVFCLLSGAIYLFNDRMDLENDRQHPKKKLRPLASGRLSLRVLHIGGAIVTLIALAWAWWLGRNFLIISVVFLGLNLLYSTWMKHQVLLDAFGIAMNFVLRAVAGVAVLAEHLVTGFGSAGEESSVLLSPWLLLCTFFGSLFLAFAKRRSELLSLEDPSKHRRVLAQYSPALLDQLVSLAAGAVILAYALYTLWPTTVASFGSSFLISNLFVDFGVMRYLFLVYRLDSGGDPSEILLRDRPILSTTLLWVLFTAWKAGGGP